MIFKAPTPEGCRGFVNTPPRGLYESKGPQVTKLLLKSLSGAILLERNEWAQFRRRQTADESQLARDWQPSSIDRRAHPSSCM